MLHSMVPRVMAYNPIEASNNRHLILSELIAPSEIARRCREILVRTYFLSVSTSYFELFSNYYFLELELSGRYTRGSY